MSSITDELIETNLPDKTTGKYKPKRLRTLLKALMEQITLETAVRNVHRLDLAIYVTPTSPAIVAKLAGEDCYLKKVVFEIYNYDGNPIPAGDEISISFGDVVQYSGPVLPSFSIPGNTQITYTGLDNVKVKFELKGANSYSFVGAILVQEL